MTSGKKARKQRRTPAPPPVRSTGGGRKASPKVLAIGAGVIALVAVAVVLAVVLSSGGSSNSATTNASTLPDAGVVVRMFKGIPQQGTALGVPTAPVTMVEYIDLQCPFCREFELNVMPKILHSVRTGELLIQARPVAFIGEDSQRGRDAALAAAAQNRFFDFAQLLYLNQGTENTGWLNDSIISSAFASIPGLDVQEAQSVRSSSSVGTQAARFDRQAVADKLSGTPLVLVGKTGGRLTEVDNTAGAISTAIDRALG